MRKPAVVVFACAVCLAVMLLLNQVGRTDDSDAVTAITELEHRAVKADMATDRSFYEKHLADNWTAGTSFGEWETKTSLLKDMSDRQQHRMENESISDLKVRVYGSTAIATYRQSYEMLDHDRRHARTVITTDTWVKQNGAWKEVASHSSEAR
jgi:Domain of unknown function (DUF4440)